VYVIANKIQPNKVGFRVRTPCFIASSSNVRNVKHSLFYHDGKKECAQTDCNDVIPPFEHPIVQCDRRSILRSSENLFLFVSTFAATRRVAWASVEDENSAGTKVGVLRRPYASLDSLLPAIRVKMMIDMSVSKANYLVTASPSSKESSQERIKRELSDLLLNPHKFTQNSPVQDVPKKPAKEYLDSYNRDRQKIPLFQQPGAYLVQGAEIDAWKRLKRQEKQREGVDEIRAALNVYTDNLSFDSSSYALNADKKERSKLIREDRLPDIKNVIASDMGMRYLYRNQVLTAMEETRFELRYQFSKKEEDFDASNLLELLLDAQRAFDRWVIMVPEKDISEALLVVEQEALAFL